MTTADILYREVAEKLGMDYELVKKINSYYWKKGVKKNLAECNHHGIFIKNFGTIVTSKFKLNNEILKQIYFIRRVRYSRYIGERKKGFIIDYLKTNLTKLLQRRNEIAIEFYNKRQR